MGNITSNQGLEEKEEEEGYKIMIKFFIMADAEMSTLAYNMTKFMNGIQRNGGLIISTHIIRDVNPLLTGVVFYSETKNERIVTKQKTSLPRALLRLQEKEGESSK